MKRKKFLATITAGVAAIVLKPLVLFGRIRQAGLQESYPISEPGKPFAPDSLWYTPLSLDATVVATAALTTHIGNIGDPIGDNNGSPVENVRTGPEEDVIAVALGPVGVPADVLGLASAEDIEAANTGHPESLNVEQVPMRPNGRSIGLTWPLRSPGWQGHPDSASKLLPAAYYHATSPHSQVSANASFRWKGFKIDRNWVMTNKRTSSMTPEEIAELNASYKGIIAKPDNLQMPYQGNACIAIIGEHPIAGAGTCIWQSLSCERPEPGSDIWVFGESTVVASPNSSGYMKFENTQMGHRGWLGYFTGAKSNEIWPGSAAHGLTPPEYALNKGLSLGTGYFDISAAGSHGGSSLSSIGSTILISELCAEGESIDTIRHALGLNVFSEFLAWRPHLLPQDVPPQNLLQQNPYISETNPESLGKRDFNGPGRVFPARAYDSDAWNNDVRGDHEGDTDSSKDYGGVDPNVTMGSLLILPSEKLKPQNVTPFNPEDLETLPGKRIAWALMHYGGYINDIVPGDNADPAKEQHHFMIATEERYRPYAAVADEKHYSLRRYFYKRFGYPMYCQRNHDSSTLNGTPWPGDASFTGGRKARAAYRSDIVKIMRALCVVTSNGPKTIGGGVGNRIIEQTERKPHTVFGGHFKIEGNNVPFENLDLYHYSKGSWKKVIVDIFGNPFKNKAYGADAASGASIWYNIGDRGWYKVRSNTAPGANDGPYFPPVLVELWVPKLADISLSCKGNIVPKTDLNVFPVPYNPVKGNLTIRFNPVAGSITTISILNVNGQRVRQLNVSVPVSQNQGFAQWDGKNESGKTVPDGSYVGIIQNSDGKRSFKITVSC